MQILRPATLRAHRCPPESLSWPVRRRRKIYGGSGREWGQLVLSGLCLACFAGSTGPGFAQVPFAPPPAPSVSPSAVRGIYDPNQPNNSPAQMASPPGRQQFGAVSAPIPESGSSVAPSPETPTELHNIQPLEGAEIVARIDGEVVLASDMLWIVNMIVEANQDRIPPNQVEEARKALLRQQVMGLIDTKVLFADFKRKVPAENIPKIQENLDEPFEEMEIPRLIQMLKVENKQQLVEKLDHYGTTLTDLKRQFFERTIAGEWMRQMAPKPKSVTHEEMLSYYKEHKAEYEFQAQVRWEELMVRFNRFGGDRAAAWRAITEMGNEVWQNVMKNPQIRGPVFAEIAQAKSHGFTAQAGGIHDWTTQGALRSTEIDETLFSLQEGQLSQVIETEAGFHIVRVLERKEADCTPFTEAQSEIRENLTEAAKREGGQGELEELRNRSRIWTIFDGEFRGSQIAQLNGDAVRR